MIFCDELVKMYMSDGLKVMALQGLDLTVKKGEMMAIVGKSGSGKSSLLNMIGGLDSPTAGRLFVDGRDISALSRKEMLDYRSRKIGFVWQRGSRNLVPYLTVQQNVEAPMCLIGEKRADRQKRAKQLLQEVGMEQHAHKLPGQLSGGEQQRVAIAVALANGPQILLADEPTGAVDTKASDRIFKLFQKINRELGVTILIVTHDKSIAGKVDRTVMISDGKISTEKLRKDPAARERAAQLAGFFPEEGESGQEEYSILDKAHRLQLTEEIRRKAGIDTNKVKVRVVDGKVVISRE